MVIDAIGIILTAHKTAAGTPIQPLFAKDHKGTVVVEEIYRKGLEGLEGFSHVWLLYGFHLSRKIRLRVTPFMSDKEMGVFATRSPGRPNSIGMTLVAIEEVTATGLEVSGVDMLDGTPLYDIKPFFGRLEIPDQWRTGWLDEASMKAENPRIADNRFAD
jgi:tRNA (adenine37-N6)-methyltransferase